MAIAAPLPSHGVDTVKSSDRQTGGTPPSENIKEMDSLSTFSVVQSAVVSVNERTEGDCASLISSEPVHFMSDPLEEYRRAVRGWGSKRDMDGTPSSSSRKGRSARSTGNGSALVVANSHSRAQSEEMEGLTAQLSSQVRS